MISVILLFIGTYIYCEKSDYAGQRDTYSGQKKRNLVKPMMVVSTTGHIIDILGPYLANNNDAVILQDQLRSTESNSLKDFVGENGVMVVDRGFRDAVAEAESLGFVMKIPTILLGGEKIMSTELANSTRLVESANSRLKIFKHFKRTLPTACLQYLSADLRITAALINKFMPELTTNSQKNTEWANSMMQRISIRNESQRLCSDELATKKKSVWKPLFAKDVLDFPKLTKSELEQLCFGVYQLRQAKSYTDEHTNQAGSYEIKFCQIETGLIQVRIQI